MRQTAVTDVLTHTNGNLFALIFSAEQCFQRLTDDNLCRETNIIVHILLAEPNGFLSSDRKRLCLDVLRTECC